MDSLARILPFLYPHRRKIFLSFLFAILTAFLWGANLSVAFPIVKVLLQGQGLKDYVGKAIVAAEIESAHRTESLKKLDQEIEKLKATEAAASTSRLEASTDEMVGLLSDHARTQRKLSTVSRKLLLANWINTYIIPWVPGDQFDCFAALLALLLLATILKGLCIFTQDVLIGSVVELTVMGIRKECFRRTLDLDLQSISRDGTAGLMSRFTNDVTVMSNGLLLLGGKVIREPLKAIMCVIFAFIVNWRLTLLSLLFVPVMGLVFYRYGQLLKSASHRMMDSMSRIYKSLEETFDSFKVVVAFNASRRHRARFHRENREYYRKAMKVVRIDSLTSPTTELLGMLAVFIAVLPGAYLVLRSTTEIWEIRLASEPMDIATLSVLYAFLAGVIDPMRKLSSLYSKLKRSSAATERIFEMIDRRPLVKQVEQPKLLPRHRSNISFENVTFTYTSFDSKVKSRPPALKNVSLDVTAGEIIAIVGENGSGKSTLVNLLPRFYDPDEGKIRIDGVAISDASLRDLRSQIGVVTQETLLFDETIFENIRYGNPSASREEVALAAEQAHVSQFIEDLPEGIETVVGEKGQRLSGGQRQRISLARAILRDPAILILDEATSAIDAQSESLIYETLQEFAQSRTAFLITHAINGGILDLITKIVVMDQGQLVSTGTHDELIESCPTYKRIFEAQTQQQQSGRSDSQQSQSLNRNPYSEDEHNPKAAAETFPNVIPFKGAG